MKTLSIISLFFTCFLSVQAENTVIPRPKKVVYAEGSFILNANTRLVAQGESRLAAVYLQHFLAQSGLNLQFSSEETGEKGAVISFISSDDSRKLKGEGYILKVSPLGVEIDAADYRGHFYGIQTLIQMLPAEAHDRFLPMAEAEIRNVRIVDEPRFPWRSMMLDCSRQFFTIDFLKKYIDTLSLYKINVFHWHLSDNEGWRFESKKYPLLTRLGAWRGVNEILPPSRGSGDRRYGGFYTQEQMKELVAYAKVRNVQILPEIDVPGHCAAVCGAYPETLCQDKGVDSRRNTLCVGREENFTMLRHLFEELAEIFPFEYIHVGGDEVKKLAWSHCSLCQEKKLLLKLKDEDELQNYFIRRVEKIVKSQGKKMLGWNEILKGGELAKDTMVMAWEGIKPGVEAAKRNHRVIMSPGPYAYFDMAQKSRERGHSWAGFINSEKVYSYEPQEKMELTKTQLQNIYGVGACLWSEYLDKKDYVWHQTYPRLLALAEVAWTPPHLKNWEDFSRRLEENHSFFLEARRIPYRISPPRVKWQGGRIYVKKPYGKAEVRYTLDGSAPNETSAVYKEAIELADPKLFKCIHVAKTGRHSSVAQFEDLRKISEKGLVKPGYKLISPHKPREKNPLSLTGDGNRATHVWFETSFRKDELIDIVFDKPLQADYLECRSGVPKTIRSIVENGVLEYSEGGEYKVLAKFEKGDAKASVAGLNIVALRIRFLSDQSEWTAVQDLIIRKN